MAQRRASLAALSALAWATSAAGQSATDAKSPPAEAAAPTTNTDADPPIPHPVFVALTAGGEVGANYDIGAEIALLTNPFSSGISLGGSAFVAPYTASENLCTQPPTCNQHPVLFRWMAEIRLGTAYREHVRGLFWLGLGAGVAYLGEPQLSPGPSAAVAVGGDVRLAGSLWLELSPRLTWAQLIGPGTSFGGTYFTFGLEVGVRIDLLH